MLLRDDFGAPYPKTFSQIGNREDIYDWLRGPVASTFYTGQHVTNPDGSVALHTSNPNIRAPSAFTVRQLRMPVIDGNSPDFHDTCAWSYNGSCSMPYSKSGQDESPFGPAKADLASSRAHAKNLSGTILSLAPSS